MPMSTNAKIAIAVGVTAVIGLVAASSLAKPKTTALPPPPPPDNPAMANIFAVLDHAAEYESDINVLRDLRDKVLAAAMNDKTWDPYFTKIQNRLNNLSPAERVAAVSGASAQSFRQVLAR